MTTLETRPTIVDTTNDHAADRQAIAQVIADVERGFNTKDVERSVGHFAANGWAVAVSGVRSTGIDSLVAAHRVGYAGPLADQYASYDLADVTFVRDDVALATKLARATTADGEPIDVDHAMIGLYVLVREDGRWWIVARQNTLTK